MENKINIASIKQLHPNIKVRFICAFLSKTATGITIPFMALYFSSSFGKSLTGIALSVNIILQLIFSLIGGYLADIFPRKRILFLGYLGNCLCYLGMALSSVNNPFYVLIFFLLSSIFTSLPESSLEALILDSATSRDKKLIFTIDYWIINLTMALGMMIGSLFYIKYKFQLLLSVSFTLLITTILYQIFIKDGNGNPSNKVKSEENFIQNYITIAKDTKWMVYIISGILIYSAELSMGNYISIRIVEDFKSLTIGEFYIDGIKAFSLLQIENTILVVLFTFFVINFSKKYKEKNIFCIGLLLNIISYGILAQSNNIVVLLILMFIATMGELLYAPIRQTKRLNLIPDNKRSSYLAVDSFSIYGASILASLSISIGALIQSELMSIYIIFIGLIGTLLNYLVFYRNPKNNTIKEFLNFHFRKS